ncbi:MAG: hypothetical protein ABJ242_04045 [Marinomonas sp.]
MPEYNEAPHKGGATWNSLVGPFHISHNLTSNAPQAQTDGRSALFLLCPSSRFQVEVNYV